MSKKILLPSLAAALLTQLPVAHAVESGDLILRAGAVSVMPSGESGTDLSNGTNAKIEPNDNTQLGLTASYMLTDNLAVGILAATPFEHKVSSAGTKIADIKHLPPTVTAQYHFTDLGSIKPYVGAGINYTTFFDEELNNGTNIELKDSLGLAVEAGIDVDLGNDYFFNAAIWYIDIETEVELNNGTTAIDGIDIDPVVGMLGIGKKF